MIEIGFLPFAAPTARTAAGLPTCSAIWPVGAGFTVRNAEQRRPDPALKIRAAKFECQLECPALADEIFAELTGNLEQKRMSRLLVRVFKRDTTVTRRSPDERDQRLTGGDKRELADRRGDDTAEMFEVFGCGHGSPENDS